MDFDHRPGVEKKFKIAAWLARNSAKTDRSEVEAEIAKCDVVCANCHRIRTQMRLGSDEEPENSGKMARRSGQSH